MLYPVIIHKDEGTLYGIIVPDFPGCISAAETQEGISMMVQDVVSLWMEETKEAVPVPSRIEDVAASEDAEGGFVMLIDVEVSLAEK